MTKQIDAKLKLVNEEFDKLKSEQDSDKKIIQETQQTMQQREIRLVQLQGENKALTELQEGSEPSKTESK